MFVLIHCRQFKNLVLGLETNRLTYVFRLIDDHGITFFPGWSNINGVCMENFMSP